MYVSVFLIQFTYWGKVLNYFEYIHKFPDKICTEVFLFSIHLQPVT